MKPELSQQELSRERDRLRLLLEVNNALASNLNLRDLLQAISTSLRHLTPHDYTGLAIYDEKYGQLRISRVERTDTEGVLPEGELIPMEGTSAGLAFTTRQIVRRDRIDLEEFDAAEFKSMVEALQIKSLCVLPLIMRDRPIGIVSLASRTEAAFSEADAQLLSEIVPQIAIAVENAVNFQQAQWERDRRQLLLEVNNAVVSNLSLHELLVAISGWVGKFLKHEVASVVLLDQKTGHLRLHALDKPAPGNVMREGGIIPSEGTPVGLAIKTRATVRRDSLDLNEFNSPLVKMAYAAGLRSGMSVCLISHGRLMGTINVGSSHEAVFDQQDQQLLEEVADQVAIAVENALNFEEANRERARAETLLEINNAITTHLDLRDLIRATSECLRKYFENDIVGMALYEPELNMLRVHALDGTSPSDNWIDEGFLMPIEGTPAGKCFTTRKPLLLSTFSAAEFNSPAVERAIAAGIKSACNAPLVAHDRALGSVVIASKKEGAFDETDAEMLTNVAKQLAIAVENALNF